MTNNAKAKATVQTTP